MFDFGNVAEVKVGGFDEGVNIRSKGKGGMMPWLCVKGEGVMVRLSMVSEMGPYLFRIGVVPMRRSLVLSTMSLRKL